MLTIDEMHDCVTTFLREGGYADGVWKPGPKYDTRASTRIPVYGITYSNTATPLIPSAVKLEITEGWILRGGMEHGDSEVSPKIWLQDNSRGRVWFTEVKSKSDLLQYLESKFPTGQALANSVKTANVAMQATRFRAEQEILYDNTVKECISDQHIQLLVEATVETLVCRGLSIQIYPKLKDSLLHHLSARLQEAVTRDLEAVTIQ